MEPPTGQWVFALAIVTANVVGLVVTLRVGFLALVSMLLTANAISALPFAPGAPGVTGTLSWITLAAAVAPAALGWYTSLAGKSIFGED